MFKLSLLIFLCTIILTGFSQEITSFFKTPPSNHNAESQIWSLQNVQGGQRRAKPCPRRRSKNDAEEQWIPSYSSRITHPLFENAVLQPQALKNEEVTLKVSPKIGTEQQSYLDQSSFDVWNINSADLSKDDCVDQLEPDNDDSLKTADAAKTALKIIQDCLKKKQNDKNVTSIIGGGSSRRSMSNLDDGTDLLDNYENNNNNYPRDVTSDDSNSLENNNYTLQKNEDGVSRNAGPQNNFEDRNSNQLTTKLIDPEIGTGIAKSPVIENRQKNPRVCYACSTATNPSCWDPDNRTTVKYCAREKSCVTKSFGVKNSVTMIRDCANSCEDSSVPGLEPKYKSCKLCHSDYCNAAVSINSYNVVILLIISIVKCTF